MCIRRQNNTTRGFILHSSYLDSRINSRADSGVCSLCLCETSPGERAPTIRRVLAAETRRDASVTFQRLRGCFQFVDLSSFFLFLCLFLFLSSTSSPSLSPVPLGVSQHGFGPFPSPISHLPCPHLIRAETRLRMTITCQHTHTHCTLPSLLSLMSTTICVSRHQL